MSMTPGWQFMQDGLLVVGFNHQGGPRGGGEAIVPNWWMGMASRNTAQGQVTFTGMLSLEPATLGRNGYREIFQVGEALDGRPLVDRQHPHDFFMQLAAEWRVPLGGETRLTLAGGPVGEPALGPVAFMHRASAGDNPTAPLGHHTFDSTHIAFGVVTAAVDRGAWTFEGSVFNGREPDDRRWDFDLGALDSVSGRVWYRPRPGWDIQASAGRLNDPEELEPGDVIRSTVSVSWTRTAGAGVHAATIAYGRNAADHGGRGALLVEGAARVAESISLYGRFEAAQVDAHTLLAPGIGNPEAAGSVLALTIGGVRDIVRARGVTGGIGADVTFTRSPASLVAAYDPHPVSFRVFFSLRPSSGRMLNMRMAQPTLGGTPQP